MKGIILAGGTGSRLYPITKCISKHLLPIYDKPMVYYPLSVLMLAGIKDILIITTPRDQRSFESLLGNGSHLGLKISYAIQEIPKGIPDAFIIGENFINGDKVALILGDNIFYGDSFSQIIRSMTSKPYNALIFAYYVKYPGSFGVVEFDADKNVISIEEKPKTPKSNYAVTGLYLYDENVSEIARNIKPSHRGELEITAMNREYMKQEKLQVEVLGRGFTWLDAGTPETLLEATHFVSTIQERQGLKIACIEEIAYRLGYIDLKQLSKLADPLLNTEYGQYLLQLENEEV